MRLPALERRWSSSSQDCRRYNAALPAKVGVTGSLRQDVLLTLRHDHRHPEGPSESYLRKSADSEPYCHPEILIVSPHLRRDAQLVQGWISAIRQRTLTFMKLPEGW